MKKCRQIRRRMYHLNQSTAPRRLCTLHTRYTHTHTLTAENDTAENGTGNFLRISHFHFSSSSSSIRFHSQRVKGCCTPFSCCSNNHNNNNNQILVFNFNSARLLTATRFQSAGRQTGRPPQFIFFICLRLSVQLE